MRNKDRFSVYQIHFITKLRLMKEIRRLTATTKLAVLGMIDFQSNQTRDPSVTVTIYHCANASKSESSRINNV